MNMGDRLSVFHKFKNDGLRIIITKMLNFLSESLFPSHVVERPANMLENGIVLAQTGDVIDFDFSFAEVQTELTAEQEYTLAEWQDLNAYYKDLTNYNLFDRGFEG
jgi:hypothetical protein